MRDDGLDPRLVGALRDYSRGGLRPIHATAIAEGVIGRGKRRPPLPGRLRVTPMRIWPPAREHVAGWLVLIASAAIVVGIVGIGRIPQIGGIGDGPSAPLPSSSAIASGPPSPTIVNPASPGPIQSLTVDGLPFSVRLPGPWLGRGWQTYGSLLVSKSVEGPQGAEAVVFWAGFPDGIEADPCINEPIERWNAADVADFIASAPGTALVTAPENVTVGGYPAKHVVVVVREDLGCDPGFFYNWKAQTGGAMWVKNLLGDTIQVWIVQVGSQLVFIASETHRDVRPGEPLSETARSRLDQEIQQIVDSIRFE